MNEPINNDVLRDWIRVTDESLNRIENNLNRLLIRDAANRKECASRDAAGFAVGPEMPPDLVITGSHLADDVYCCAVEFMGPAAHITKKGSPTESPNIDAHAAKSIIKWLAEFVTWAEARK